MSDLGAQDWRAEFAVYRVGFSTIVPI